MTLLIPTELHNVILGAIAYNLQQTGLEATVFPGEPGVSTPATPSTLAVYELELDGVVLHVRLAVTAVERAQTGG